MWAAIPGWPMPPTRRADDSARRSGLIGTYKVLELYQDQESLTAHRGTDYFRELGRKLEPCMAGRPEVEYLDAVG